jgi:enediyne biosynthesis protein E4
VVRAIGALWALPLVLAGCRRAAPPPFELLDAKRTGITFTNTLPEDTSFNILNYLYYYNGAGVAVGDVNNDGLPDLYFTSNLGSNRLYLNKGNYRFEDITARAGVADSVGWKSGVTMADVNGDGWVDIYVSGVSYLGVRGRNVLYINNHDGTFTDRTKEYGLDFEGYSTQALFFDYDGDGDLDMYLLNHSVHSEHGSGSAASRSERNPRAGDRLYRNDNGHFVDVSEQAGIYGGVFGYGLGVVATDIDGDGCMDLYVANDFQEDDFLYHNNCDGTFSEIGAAAMAHTSRSSMGVDAADFNNDGRPDIFSADMLPWRQDVLETSATAEPYALYKMKLQAGYRPQLAHNALQLNQGAGHFSEIGYLAGVAATDWSWAPLFADLDDDGRKDLFITSGIYRRPTDLDYLAYVAQPAVQRSLQAGITRQNLTVANRMPHLPAPNHAFRNEGNLTFRDVSAAWGLSEPGFSNGAAYVDLDNSGALDLVINRVNAPAAIYRNHLRDSSHAHFLRVELRGTGGNTEGIGAKVFVKAGGATQLLEQMPTRGYESSVDHRLHFGLGSATRADSVTIVWPNRWRQVLTNLAVDTALTLDQRAASPPSLAISESQARPAAEARAAGCVGPCASGSPIFSDVSNQLRIDWRHRENEPYDLEREPLLPHFLSDRGPALAVGDVNGDGLEDLYVGGAKWQPGAIYLQQRDGTFRASPQPAFNADSLFEDVDAAIFDANGDGHPDLYVVSGGNEFSDSDDALQDRLYLGDGHGTFRRDTSALPRMAESGSCVVVADFNGDGHPDLFVGRRSVSRAYGASPQSYLLENDGAGHFRDVTQALAPGLADAGMVTSAAWVDYDHDGRLDLIVTGEWMPVRVFHQESGRFVDRTKEAGLAASDGWWNSITVADLNGDGRPDLVLGNLGLNSYLKASPAEPVRLYVGDFAHNGSSIGILTAYTNDTSYVVPARDELLRMLPALRDRYPTYKSFAGRRIEDVLPASDLRGAAVRQASDFATSVALNDGHGAFQLRALPSEAQVSTVDASLIDDFDGDGRPDVLLAGNDYGVPPLFGRYDASYGLVLRGAGGMGPGQPLFEPIGLTASGLVLEGQVRHIKALRWARGGRLIVAARNDDKLQVLRFAPSPRSPSNTVSRP